MYTLFGGILNVFWPPEGQNTVSASDVKVPSVCSASEVEVHDDQEEHDDNDEQDEEKMKNSDEVEWHLHSPAAVIYSFGIIHHHHFSYFLFRELQGRKWQPMKKCLLWSITFSPISSFPWRFLKVSHQRGVWILARALLLYSLSNMLVQICSINELREALLFWH